MLEKEDIQKLAKLSRLAVDDSEIAELTSHLDGMLHHMEALRALDLSDVEPMTGAENAQTSLREDVPLEGLSEEVAFKNAPESESNYFVIPKVIGA